MSRVTSGGGQRGKLRREQRLISIPYFSSSHPANATCVGCEQVVSQVWRCYHHIEVRPESIGRVLGVGMRVAGRLAGQAIMGESQQNNAATPNAQPGALQADAAARGRAAGQTTRGLARGLSGFFKPFRNVGGKIWLEVTGVFFLLPVLVFSPVLWRTRASWQHGPDHRTFLAAAVIIVIFLYLGVSSFWRAGRRR
jgi:hypothetical protein